MATRSFIRIPPDSSGKRLDAYAYDVDSETRYAQALVFVDTEGEPLGTEANPVQVEVGNWPASQVVEGTVDVGNFPALYDVSDRADREVGEVSVPGGVVASQAGAWSVTETDPLDLSALATLAEQEAQTAHLATLAATDFATGTDIAGLSTAITGIDFATGADITALTSALTPVGGLPVDIQDASIAVTVGEVEVKNDAGDPLAVTVSNPTDITDLATLAEQQAQTTHLATLAGIDYATGADISALAATTLTVDTELPDAAALGNTTSNPTVPGVGSFGMLYNGSTWDRMRGDTTNGLDVDVTRVSGTVTVDSELPAAAALADSTANPTVPTVGVATLLYNGATWDRMRGTVANGLLVDVSRVQGTVAVTQSGAWTVAATQSGSWSVTADTELPAAAALADATANPSLPGVGAYGYVYNGSTWDRMRGDTTNGLDVDVTRVQGTVAVTQSGAWSVTADTELPAAAALADATANPTVPGVGAYGLMFNGSTWDRLRGDTTNGLDVDVTRVQGTVAVTQSGAWTVAATQSGGWSVTADTELPAAAALADATANPTVPGVAAFGHFYNGSTWDRMRGDTTNGLDVDVTRVSGTVTVDTELPAAAAPADATANPTVPGVGAYGLMYNGSTWDRVRGDTTNGLDVDVTRVSGTVTVDSELPAAAALADATANPTVPGVSAFGLVYNGSTWDRARTLSAVAGGTSGAGLLAAGLVVTDGTTYRQPLVASGLADTHTGVNLLSMGGWIYNGTTWDRMRGDTTNGLDVDVTRVSGTVTVDSELPAAAALADTKANPTVPGVGTYDHVYNGATWDRTRSLAAFTENSASGAEGVAVAAMGLQLGTGAATAVVAASRVTDAFAGFTIPPSAGLIYNGSTWDRVRAATGATGTAKVSQTPATAGGASSYRKLASADTNLATIKASAGQVYGWSITNVAAATKFVKLYDKAANPTLASDTPKLTLAIPPGQHVTQAPSTGIAFSTGIAIAMTGAVGDTDATGLTANDVILNLLYA